MTLFHVVQLAFAIAVIALTIERCRVIFYVRAIEAAPFRAAIARLLRAQRFEDARALASAARPAHAAEALWAMLDPTVAEEERHVESQDRLARIEDHVTRGLRALRIAASIGSVLGFIGAAIEIRWVFAGDHGLMGLEAGLVENIGLWNAAVSIAMGVATSTYALGTWGILRNGARDLVAEGRRALGTVEDLLEPPADLERSREKVQASGTPAQPRGQSDGRPQGSSFEESG